MAPFMANALASAPRVGAKPARGSGPAENSHINLEALHRFHAYCARFPSEMAETAIQEFSKAGESVLDPFCGSGTSLTAGLFHGRHVIGTDVDILAGMLSRVKCFPQAPTRYAAWRSQFADKLKSVFSEIEHGWPAVAAMPQPGAEFAIGDLAVSLPNFPELN